VLVRRDTGEKTAVPIDNLEDTVTDMLNSIQAGLYARAKRFMDENTHVIDNYKEFKTIMENRRGLIFAPWCGSQECEVAVKEETGATIRCIPMNAQPKSGKCIYCGDNATTWVYFAKAY